MRIGVGGGLGPVRLGVSNKGFGGGVGPVSAGGSWKGGRRTGGSDGMTGCGMVLLLIMLWLVVISPYLLGTWLAVKFGAQDPSTTRTVTGWTFEVVAVCVVLWLAIRLLWGSRRQRRTERLRQQETEFTAQEIRTGLLEMRSAMASPSPRPLIERSEIPWHQDIPADEVILCFVDAISSSPSAFENAVETDIAFTNHSIVVRIGDGTHLYDAAGVYAHPGSAPGQLRLVGPQIPGGLVVDAGDPTSSDLIRVLVDWSHCARLSMPVPQNTFDRLDSVIATF